jgi:transcriptional regulator with XRE-family HTH domain
LSERQQRRPDLLVLGEAIGQIRVERGLSPVELAAATGIEIARIQTLEAGRLDPDYEMLLALAEGLGVRPSTFVIRAEELGGEGA